MKKLWQTCLHSQETKAGFFQKREDLYTLDALFVCYLILSCLFIANQLVSYFTTSELSGEYLIVFMPIGLILMFLSAIYALKVKIFKLTFDKEKYSQYILRFDLLKAGAYIIFSVIIIESKLLQIPLKIDSAFDYGRWLAFELELIALPAIMSMQTSAIRISLIVLQFLYCYLRMESWMTEVVNAAFFFAKIFPVVFCLYKFCIFEDKLRKDKSKQAEERKFASKVLDLLPEGVAIIDENGLKYNNNSLRSILRVKDSECLDALFKLENKEYVENPLDNSNVKRGQSYTPSTQLDTGKYDIFGTKNPLLKTGISTKQDSNTKSPPEKTRKNKKSETSKLYKVIVDDQAAGKKKAPTVSNDINTHFENGSRDLEAHQMMYEPLPPNSPGSIRQQNDSIGTIGDQSNLLTPWKLNTKQSEKPPTPSKWKKFDGYTFNKINREEKQENIQPLAQEVKPKKTSMTSLAEVGTIRLRIKQIIEKIHQPYKRSQHKNVGEASRELLIKLKEQFSNEDMQYSQASRSVKQGSESSHKKYMSRSATFQSERPSSKKKTAFLTMNKWAMVMSSERESLSGNLQRLEIKFTPVIADEKPSLIILVRDVTEKEIIRQMEEKERNQSQALAAVSHEFRTPLNGILGMLDTLKEHIETTVCQNFLMPAYNSAKLLLTLVNDILDFHQMKEQKLTLVPVQFNLKSKLEDCLSLISIQAKRRGVEAKVMMDNNVPILIHNDPNRMQQVVNNLLGNAIKFTLEGSIIIKVENYDDNKITIKVMDTGLGIEPKNIEKLFKTFGKIDSQKNRELNPQGVGLGLTISNSLAELLCSDKKIGGLNVVSEYQKGSCFWFIIDDLRPQSHSCELDEDDEKALFENMEDLNSRYLFSKKDIQPDTQEALSSVHNIVTNAKIPKLRSELLLKPYEMSDPEPGKRVVNTEPFLLNNQEATLKELLEKLQVKRNASTSILVADDNDINQLVFQSFLKSFDLTIDSVYNGKQALDKVLQKNIESNNPSYSIVFLDVEMPTMGGIECARELIKLMENGVIPKVPLVGQSGHDDDEEITKCMQAGMSGYLRKPITRPQLLDTLIKWLTKEAEAK